MRSAAQVGRLLKPLHTVVSRTLRFMQAMHLGPGRGRAAQEGLAQRSDCQARGVIAAARHAAAAAAARVLDRWVVLGGVPRGVASPRWRLRRYLGRLGGGHCAAHASATQECVPVRTEAP